VKNVPYTSFIFPKSSLDARRTSCRVVETEFPHRQGCGSLLTIQGTQNVLYAQSRAKPQRLEACSDHKLPR
jgi:hypothetical protein